MAIIIIVNEEINTKWKDTHVLTHTRTHTFERKKIHIGTGDKYKTGRKTNRFKTCAVRESNPGRKNGNLA